MSTHSTVLTALLRCSLGIVVSLVFSSAAFAAPVWPSNSAALQECAAFLDPDRCEAMPRRVRKPLRERMIHNLHRISQRWQAMSEADHLALEMRLVAAIPSAWAGGLLVSLVQF